MTRTPRSWTRRHPSSAARLAVAAIVTAFLAAALAACSDSTSPGTTTLSDAQVAADVAATAGEAIAGDVADFAGDFGAASGCPYDAATTTHVCAAVTERGLAVTRSYQFRDVASTPTQSYDAANTASIVFTRAAEGTFTATTESGTTLTSSVHRSAQRTVTGLLGDESQRVWNGTGESHDTSDYSGSGGTRHYAGAATETARDVVVKLPRTTFPYPTSGTITRDVTLTLTVTGYRNGTRTVSRSTVVTFNGTATVPLVVNGTVTCTLNLDTGKVGGCGAT